MVKDLQSAGFTDAQAEAVARNLRDASPRSRGQVGRLRDIPSLRHYVLVERDTQHIETIDRIGEAWSGFRIADGLCASLSLRAFGVEIPLAEIYADVFEPE